MPNAEQVKYWNGEAGDNWVAQADALDLMMQDIGGAVLASAALGPGNRVLDIGCGSGVLTLAAQKQVGSSGQAIGLDISRPLIENAQSRAKEQHSSAVFVEADAATWRADTPVDNIVSRFGVMFFDNPIAAFSNILLSAKPGARLTFACWRSPKENDMGGAMMKAISHLFTPPSVKPDPTAPGPYAFADQSYVNGILTQAGWRDVNFAQWNGAMPLPCSSARDNATFLTHMGAVGRMMREQKVPAESVIDTLTTFLEPRKKGERFVLNAGVWIVSAWR